MYQEIIFTFAPNNTLLYLFDQLKNKAEINFEAAKLLQEHYFFAPSVHCSYYSVLQLMKHSVKEKIGISYEEQKIEIQHLKQKRASAKGTHEYLIERIGNQIWKIEPKSFNEFDRKIKQLKRFRNCSDYDDKEITYDVSHKALGYADSLKKQIKKIFNT